MEIIWVFTNTYGFIYKNAPVSVYLPKAWKCWWLSWEHKLLSSFTEFKLSWLKRKLRLLVFLAPCEGRLRVASGCVWCLWGQAGAGLGWWFAVGAPLCGCRDGNPRMAQRGPTASAPASLARPLSKKGFSSSTIWYLPCSCQVTTENQARSF